MDNYTDNKYSLNELIYMESEIKCYFSAYDYRKNGCLRSKRNCKECDNIEDCYDLACQYCSDEMFDSIGYFGFNSMDEFWDSTI